MTILNLCPLLYHDFTQDTNTSTSLINLFTMIPNFLGHISDNLHYNPSLSITGSVVFPLHAPEFCHFIQSQHTTVGARQQSKENLKKEVKWNTAAHQVCGWKAHYSIKGSQDKKQKENINTIHPRGVLVCLLSHEQVCTLCTG